MVDFRGMATWGVKGYLSVTTVYDAAGRTKHTSRLGFPRTLQPDQRSAASRFLIFRPPPTVSTGPRKNATVTAMLCFLHLRRPWCQHFCHLAYFLRADRSGQEGGPGLETPQYPDRLLDLLNESLAQPRLPSQLTFNGLLCLL